MCIRCLLPARAVPALKRKPHESAERRAGRAAQRACWPDSIRCVFQAVPVRKRTDEIENAPAHLRILDAHEREAQLQAFTARKEFHHGRGLTRFGETARLPVRVGVFVEEADGHTEDSSHLKEAACSDSIDSLFVLLDLLERKT